MKKGWLKNYKDGGKVSTSDNTSAKPTPIYVDSPNDPRYKAYQDSLNAYNDSKDADHYWTNQYYKKETGHKSPINVGGEDSGIEDIDRNKGRIPESWTWFTDSKRGYPNTPTTVPMYKKPVQSFKIGHEPVSVINHINPVEYQSENTFIPQQRQVPDPPTHEWYTNNQNVPIWANEDEVMQKLYNEDGTRKYQVGGKIDNTSYTGNERYAKAQDWLNTVPQNQTYIRQAPDNMVLAHEAGKQKAFEDKWDYVNKNYIQPAQMVNDAYILAEGVNSIPAVGKYLYNGIKNVPKLSKEALENLNKLYKGESASAASPFVDPITVTYDPLTTYRRKVIQEPEFVPIQENTPNKYIESNRNIYGQLVEPTEQVPKRTQKLKNIRTNRKNEYDAYKEWFKKNRPNDKFEPDAMPKSEIDPYTGYEMYKPSKEGFDPTMSNPWSNANIDKAHVKSNLPMFVTKGPFDGFDIGELFEQGYQKEPWVIGEKSFGSYGEPDIDKSAKYFAHEYPEHYTDFGPHPPVKSVEDIVRRQLNPNRFPDALVPKVRQQNKYGGKIQNNWLEYYK